MLVFRVKVPFGKRQTLFREGYVFRYIRYVRVRRKKNIKEVSSVISDFAALTKGQIKNWPHFIRRYLSYHACDCAPAYVFPQRCEEEE